MVQELKIWPKYFGAILDGSKKFEYRIDDRGFKVGDILMLREWDNVTGKYTNKVVLCNVTYILYVLGIPDIMGNVNYAVMSISNIRLSTPETAKFSMFQEEKHKGEPC